MGVYTDDFNRANGGVGANWTDINGTFGITSNQARPLSVGGDGRAQSVFDIATFDNDQYAQATLVNVSTYAGVIVRGSLVAYTCYQAVASGTNSLIQKIVAGSASNLATGPAFANSDVMKLEVHGTQLTLYKNGVAVATASDSAIASGRPGITGNSSSVTAGDNWEGGDFILSFPALTVKPSADGLAGYRVPNTIYGEGQGGYTFTRPRNTRRRYGFTLTYHLMPQADLDTLCDFVDNDAIGGAMPFRWTHPTTSVVYTVLFKETPSWKSVGFNQGATEMYEVEFTIEEP